LLQRTRVGEQLGEPVAVQGVLLDHLAGVAQKELAHFAEPAGDVDLRRIERASAALLLAQPPAVVLAAVEVVERALATLVGSRKARQPALRVAAEHEAPASEGALSHAVSSARARRPGRRSRAWRAPPRRRRRGWWPPLR